MDRQRREATEDDRSYLDIVVGAVGALMGRKECSEIVSCRRIREWTFYIGIN